MSICCAPGPQSLTIKDLWSGWRDRQADTFSNTSGTVRWKGTVTPRLRLPADLWLPDQRGLCLRDYPSVKDVTCDVRNNKITSQRKKWNSEQEVLLVGISVTCASLSRSQPPFPLWLELCCCLCVSLWPKTCSEGVTFPWWDSGWPLPPLCSSSAPCYAEENLKFLLNEPKRQNWEPSNGNI